jgi:hypothetical protein
MCLPTIFAPQMRSICCVQSREPMERLGHPRWMLRQYGRLVCQRRSRVGTSARLPVSPMSVPK